MSGYAAEFAQNAAGVTSAKSRREGQFIHLYEGDISGSEEPVRFITLAPEIAEKGAIEAFRRKASEWENANTHPNVVSVYGRGDEPRPWIAVADTTGQPLDAVQPSLSPTEMKTVISDVAEALRNAVLYNTYHSDLRPNSIWIVPDEEGVTGLVDEWGLERAVRVAVGEPDVTPFTAPELVGDSNTGDDRADVYGLGALTYFGLTGQPPITAGADIASAITTGEIPAPSEVNSSLSSSVDNIILKALATDPADRPDSAYSFERAFTQAFTPGQQAAEDSSAATTGGSPAATSTTNETQQADGQAERDDDSRVSRRAALGMLGVSVIGVGGVGGGWLATQMSDDNGESGVATDTPTAIPADSGDKRPTGTETATEAPPPSDQILLSEDFESYAVGAYPESWQSSGNNDDQIVDDIASEGTQSFQLRGSPGGCWASLSHHPIELPANPTVEISAVIRPTSQGQEGCHNFHTNFRFSVEPAGYPSEFFTVFGFTNDGYIAAKNIGSDTLANYEYDEWYDIRLIYDQTESSTTGTYYVNGENIGEETTETPQFAGDLSYFTISTSAFVSQFDDIQITIL